MKSIITFLIVSMAGSNALSQEDLVSQNIQAPIEYGIGAGGIRFTNTLEDSKTLLSQPAGGLNQTFTSYSEAITVYWSGEGQPADEQYPLMIAVQAGYQGQMDAGELGLIGPGTQFSMHGEYGKEGAEQLTRDLYNQLEKTGDPTYDCFYEIQCQLIFTEQDNGLFVAVIPGAAFLINKIDFEIAEIRLVNNN